MPRLLNLRALCARCERAEATHWHTPSTSALCSKCLRHRQTSLDCDGPSNASTARPLKPPSPSDSTSKSQCPTSCTCCRSAPIVSRSVIAALCGRCGLAVASMVAVKGGGVLCESCAEREGGEVVSLGGGGVGLVFDNDKMDFSGGGRGKVVKEGAAGRVDLSYYQTEVPVSVVGTRRPGKRKR